MSPDAKPALGNAARKLNREFEAGRFYSGQSISDAVVTRIVGEVMNAALPRPKDRLA